MATASDEDTPTSLPGPGTADAQPGPGGLDVGERRSGDVIEAWGPDRVACVTQALCALVELFANAPDAPVTSLVPLGTSPPEDALAAILGEVIDVIDVCTVVPVRFHLAETEDGGIAGDMEVVDARDAQITGRAPIGLSVHELFLEPFGGGWRCHARVLRDATDVDDSPTGEVEGH